MNFKAQVSFELTMLILKLHEESWPKFKQVQMYQKKNGVNWVREGAGRLARNVTKKMAVRAWRARRVFFI